MKKKKPHFMPVPCKVPGAYISICSCGAIARHEDFHICIYIAIRHVKAHNPIPEETA